MESGTADAADALEVRACAELIEFSRWLPSDQDLYLLAFAVSAFRFVNLINILNIRLLNTYQHHCTVKPLWTAAEPHKSVHIRMVSTFGSF